MIEKITKTFDILSKPLSIRILKLLNNFGEICICEFGSALEKSSYEISKQLKKMKEAGLVLSKRKGKYNYYSLSKIENEGIAKIVDLVLLLEDETFEKDKSRFRRESCSIK